MNDKDRVQTFLSAFKELENELLSIAKISDYGHISFSKALNEVYYHRKNPIVAQYDNYDFLKTASDLRNILSHENDVCAPSEEFLNQFLLLKDAIVHPLTCDKIATRKIYSCKKSDPLSQVLKKMEYYSLSHVPVLDEDGCVQGIFSRSTIFDYLSMNEAFTYDKNITIGDFEEFLPLDSHLNETFLFVSQNERVDKIFSHLFKNKEHDKNVALLLMTRNGRPGEKLLGIITATDVAKYKI
ncbi:MAG: CBS domain-containing protein [Bacilli bacterium]|nr:CBS domain-containing protein [Bacilli bacterium]